MENVSRKELLKQIRLRLASGDYDDIHKHKSIKICNQIVVLGDRILNDAEIFEYYEKVTNMLKTEEYELKALGMLLDHELFDEMSVVEKQKYLLNLSKFYLSLKDEYHSKNRKLQLTLNKLEQFLNSEAFETKNCLFKEEEIEKIK